MKHWAVGLGAVLGLAASGARAGQHPFSFGYDTDVVPEGDVELEQWDWMRGPTRNPQPVAWLPNQTAFHNPNLYYVWWSPVIGLGEHLELAFPLQLVDSGSAVGLDFFSAEARWRLMPRGNDDWFQMLFRAAVVQNVISYTPPGLQADVVSSLGNRRSLHAVLDLGIQVALPSIESSNNVELPSSPVDETYDFVVLTYDLGVTYPLSGGEWQVGVESYGEIGNATTWEKNSELQYGTLYQFPQFYLGPDVAFSRGRFWFTAGCLLGLGRNAARFMPRFTWAVSL
jgi:hypothetical protein